MKLRLEYFVSGKWLLAITLASASGRIFGQETNNPPPALPSVQKIQVTSPVEYFRELLAMTPEKRDSALTKETAEKRNILLEKIQEYEAMSPEERELRLRMTQLRWYLVPLMRSPAAEREKMLSNIPAEDRPLIERRLKLWDQIPVQVQKEFLENEIHLGYLLKWNGTTAEQRSKMLESFPPDRREKLEREFAKWNSLTDEHREEISARFNQFFDLDEREKSKILAKFSELDREQMQRTLKSLESLPPDQRKQHIEAFSRFAQMTPEERNHFLKNAERWESMSDVERQAWRALLQRTVPPQPPMPPNIQRTPPVPTQSVARTNTPR